MIEFIGKFHPLFVHLPIGFILLLAVLEWLALRPHWKELATANRIILLLTIPVSVASVGCGWLLAGSGGYDTTALFWHRWLGTSVAAGAIALWMLRQRGWMIAYRRSLFVTVLLLTIASHFGGSLTHGSDFLAWPKPRSTKVIPLTEAQLLSQPVYAVAVQPLFDKYCVSCHGAKKSKAGLRMDTFALLQKGGDSGSVLEPPGNKSCLLGKRITLAVDEDDHMPPAGKPQPSKAQLAVLRWWLDSGAPTDKILADLKPPTDILETIQSVATSPASVPSESK